MKLQVYSVLDKAVNSFLQPFYARAKGEAIRSFSDACNNREHNFNKHASDFVLVHLGEFDDASGLFTSIEPQRVIGALECLVDDPFVEGAKVVDEGQPEKVRRLPM